MSLKQEEYSALVVSSHDNFITAMKSMLPVSHIRPVFTAENVSKAKREVANRDFDFVIINSPLSDDAGIDFAIDCGSKRGCMALLIVNNDALSDVYYKVYEYGVFVLPKPLTKQSMDNALRWLKTAKRKLSGVEEKTTSIEEKMKTIRLVNKAKWILISEKNMSEPEAHRYIEKAAMDKCVSKAEIAKEILNE
ncbi:MAG: ANTAR domain-containing protein [Eubacterium sp.]|nr:ANTAR domain-containing protein [Eubacterium sp.]